MNGARKDNSERAILERDDLLSSGEELGIVSTVPNSVMLFCVSALPYILQVTHKVFK